MYYDEHQGFAVRPVATQYTVVELRLMVKCKRKLWESSLFLARCIVWYYRQACGNRALEYQRYPDRASKKQQANYNYSSRWRQKPAESICWKLEGVVPAMSAPFNYPIPATARSTLVNLILPMSWLLVKRKCPRSGASQPQVRLWIPNGKKLADIRCWEAATTQ